MKAIQVHNPSPQILKPKMLWKLSFLLIQMAPKSNQNCTHLATRSTQKTGNTLYRVFPIYLVVIIYCRNIMMLDYNMLPKLCQGCYDWVYALYYLSNTEKTNLNSKTHWFQASLLWDYGALVVKMEKRELDEKHQVKRWWHLTWEGDEVGRTMQREKWPS